ncbi:MAG: response regulator [Bacteroidales bacterium]
MKIYHIIYIYTLILILLYPKELKGQEIIFKQISLEQGLSQSKVIATCRDNEGYLWAGTEDGINRISQSGIKSYHFSYSDTLRGNYIHFIEEDYHKNLWIGTDKGLLIYNRITDNFDVTEYSRNTYTACLAESNQIMFKAIDHLLIVNRHGPTYIYFKNNLLHSHSCQILRKDENSLILTGYWQGIYELNLSNGELQNLPVHGKSAYTCISRDRNGNFWVGLFGDAVKCFDKDLKLIKHIQFDKFSNNSNHNLVMDLAVDEQNQIWVVTDGGGLKKIDPIDFKVSNYTYEQGVKGSIPVNNLLNIYIDKKNAIWIGSVSGGLIGLDFPVIKSYQQTDLNNHRGLSYNIATCLAKSDSILWIGTDGNGINSLNLNTRKFKHYSQTFNLAITSVLDWSRDSLIISIYNRGIFFFNKTMGMLYPFNPSNQANFEIEHSQVSPGLYKLDDRKLLIASSQCFLHDFKSKETINLSRKSKFNHHPSIRLAGSEKQTYFFYDSDKIITFDKDNTHLTKLVQFKTSKVGNIASMTYIRDGQFWFVTRTGLYHYNTKNNKLRRHILPGINNPTIIIALSDKKIAIGNKEKVIFYEPAKNKMKFYDSSDGLLVNEYSRRGSLLAADDSFVAFAGVNGVSIIPTIEKKERADIEKNIVLTGIHLNGKKVAYHPKLSSTKELIIPAGVSKIQFQLNNTGANLFKSPVLRYRLTGYEKDFNNSSAYTIEYVNLDPGVYTLEIQHQLSNGLWSNYQILCRLRIKHYWWESPVFRLSIFSIVIGIIIFLIIKIRKDQANRLQQRMRNYEKEMYQKKILFFESINHELRTPLTLIAGPINRLLKDKQSLSNEMVETLQKISNQTAYMRHVINMVLDIRKLDQGISDMNYKATNVITFIEEIYSEFEEVYRQKRVNLVFENTTSNLTIWMDQLKIKIILANLLNNALKFSESHSTVRITLSTIKGNVEINIIDQGIGLEKSDFENLFSAYYQGMHNKEGNGIGLYYSRMLITLMGGEIIASNNEHGGATFSVRFPLNNRSNVSPKDEAKQKSPKNIEPLNKLKTNDFSILIVEDIPEMQSYLSQELKTAFSNIYISQNGKEAYELLKSKKIDIVVSDIMMPEMNGYELCSSIKQDIELSHIPVVLLTALCEDHNLKNGYACGANAYLPKPFDSDSLIHLLYTLINQQISLKDQFKKTSFAIIPEELPHSNLDKVFIEKLIQVIDENIQQPELDVDFICNRMAVSRSTLYSKMKTYIGKGVKELVNEIRIEKAKTLLRKTDLPICDIAEKVGFSQQRYFSRIFKSEVGITPSEFRSEERSF